jgi:hypothetical protein
VNPWILAVLAPAVALAALASAARWSFLVAQPDEWLLRVRGGRLVDAGVGISLWRRPGDVVARFTSNVQRVKFETEALTREHVRVTVAGFALWAVSPAGDAPFRAFRKLGIANLDAPPGDLRSPKHLLTTAQYKAFQALLDAEVQAHAATLELRELLSDPEALTGGLSQRLDLFAAGVGIEMERVLVLSARPSDPAVLAELAAEHQEALRETATRLRLETAERLRQLEIGSATKIAREQLASDREKRLATEAAELELARARLAREEAELAARLDRTRREAEAQGQAARSIGLAEEQKSQAVRDHELARLVAEKIADAVRALPLHDARWVTIGSDSPVASLAGLVSGAREWLAPADRRAAGPRASAD